MREEFWHERWSNNEIAFHQNAFNPLLQKYWPEFSLNKGTTVFVPLCGKSLDMLWLAENGYRVLGIEISSIAVSDFFIENDLTAQRSNKDTFELWQSGNIDILCGDFFNLEVQHLASVGAIYDRASLIAFPLVMRKRYVEHLRQIMPPSAETLLITLEYQQHEMEGPPFSVVLEEVRELYKYWRRVDQLRRNEILDKVPRFKEKGLSSLIEAVYRLSPLDHQQTNP